MTLRPKDCEAAEEMSHGSGSAAPPGRSSILSSYPVGVEEVMPAKVGDADFVTGWEEMVGLERLSPERSPGVDIAEHPPIYRLLLLSPSL